MPAHGTGDEGEEVRNGVKQGAVLILDIKRRTDIEGNEISALRGSRPGFRRRHVTVGEKPAKDGQGSWWRGGKSHRGEQNVSPSNTICPKAECKGPALWGCYLQCQGQDSGTFTFWRKPSPTGPTGCPTTTAKRIVFSPSSHREMRVSVQKHL